MLVALRDWYPQMADKWIDRLATLERQGVKVVYEPNERRGWVHHHTVGGAATDPRQYARQVADSHWNKWLRPGGYNFLVGTDARIREMSGLLHVGAHAGTHEWNRAAIGLAFQGDFRQRAPSDSMLNAAREFMASVPVSTDQWTHKAVRPEPTSCPGNALIQLLPLEVEDMFTAHETKQLKRLVDGLDEVGSDGSFGKYTALHLRQAGRHWTKAQIAAIAAGSAAGGATASEVIQEIIRRLGG